MEVEEDAGELHEVEEETLEELVFKNMAVGDMGDVVGYLESNAIHINVRDSFGNTLLHWAAYRGNIELTRYFLDHGADVAPHNTKDSHTPLHWASLNGETEIVQILLDRGAEVDSKDKNLHTPLFFAVDNNKPLVAHYLILCGASVLSIDCNGRTPLHMAAGKGLHSLVSLLLANGAQINIQDSAGMSPLHYAAKHKHPDCFFDLLRLGADPSLPNAEGKFAEDFGDEKLKYFMNNQVKKLPSHYLRKPEMTRARSIKWVSSAAISYVIVMLVANFYGFGFSFLAIAVLAAINTRVLLYPRADEQNPFLASITLTTFFVQSYFSVVRILPAQLDWDLVVYAHILVAVVVCSAFLNLQFWTSDSGTIDIPIAQDFKELQQDLREGAGPLTLCSICRVRRPLRAKHVRQTDKCVARFDHYCDWIGGPVGANNHKSFLLFLLLVPVHCALFLYLGYGVLPTSSSPTILLRFYDVAQDDRAFSAALFQAIFFCLAMTLQSLQQLHFVGVNLTVNEALNKKRYPHFWHNGIWTNPFSLGSYYSNFRQFLFGNVEWKRIFYLDRDLPRTRYFGGHGHIHGPHCSHGQPQQQQQESQATQEADTFVVEDI